MLAEPSRCKPWPARSRRPRHRSVLNVYLSENNGDQFADTVTSVMLLGGTDVDQPQFLAVSAGVCLATLDLPDAKVVTRRANRPGPVAVGMGR